MANFIDLNTLTNTLPAVPKLPGSRKTEKSSSFALKKTGEFQEPDSVQITRRMTLIMHFKTIIQNISKKLGDRYLLTGQTETRYLNISFLETLKMR
ncbi:unnamed protein product [Arabis nemorensis]|uniref:Uncharacterized protein n=1 Tax=Arabis nemorensis TaxID=586526 RepID=A0A565B332_9BRAS|nr:unnamed protein product [Arabis nemorensis]